MASELESWPLASTRKNPEPHCGPGLHRSPSRSTRPPSDHSVSQLTAGGDSVATHMEDPGNCGGRGSGPARICYQLDHRLASIYRSEGTPADGSKVRGNTRPAGARAISFRKSAGLL